MTATAVVEMLNRQELLPGTPGTDRRRLADSALPLLAALLILGIVVLDWMTAGIVVGVLLGVPITALSLVDNRRHIWIATGAACIGFVVAMQFGVPSTIPAEVKFANRALAFVTIPASCYLALRLQSLRVSAERARDAALSACNMNRLLTSLLAHDLRAPLILATQALEYVDARATSGAPIDHTLLTETQVRIQRHLRSIELVLGGARDGRAGGATGSNDGVSLIVPLRQQIEAEVNSFASDAAMRSKVLVMALEALDEREYRLDSMVLRQSLTILIDNALRYAVPGPVCVEAEIRGSELRVRVSDSGPAADRRGRLNTDPEGSGLGLQLCRALVASAGGSLEMERSGTSGTAFLLRLPAEPARKDNGRA